MTALSEKEIELIEVLGRNPSASQRSLASEIKISLGMVNLFVRKLAKKGLVTIRKVNQRDLQYILTPEGMKARAGYNLRYLENHLNHFVRAKELVTEKLAEVRGHGYRTVYLLAKGEWSEIGFLAAANMEVHFAGFVGTVAGSRFLGQPVYTVEEMLAMTHPPDACVLVLNGHNVPVQEQLTGKVRLFHV